MSDALFRPGKRLYLFSLFPVCVLAIFLLIVSWGYSALQHKVADESAEIILNRVSEVAQEFRNALATLNHKYDSADCSENVVTALKNDLWKYEFIRDIGLIRNGFLTCTTSGPLKHPLKIPVPSVQTNIGTGLMFDNVSLLGTGIAADVITNGDIALFVSPMMMEAMDRNVRRHGLYIELLQKNTGEVFRRSGVLPETALSDALGLPHKIYRIQRCESRGALCVRISSAINDVSDIPGYILIPLMIFGIVLGIASSYLVFIYRQRRISMETRLRKAIRAQTFTLVYQPIVKTLTGEIVGFEALIRWHDPLLGHVPPDIFIPLAERTGLASAITRVVVAIALRDVSDLLVRHRLFVSINVIPDDIRDPVFIDWLGRAVVAAGLSPEHIVLEITERANASTEDVDNGMRQLRDRGFHIAIDDFGTGYSNISWLTSNNYDKIKIDKFITNAIGTDSINNRTLMNLIVLLREIDKDIVFEGVEHGYQAQFIAEEIPEAYSQGWYFYRPLDRGAALSVMAK